MDPRPRDENHPEFLFSRRLKDWKHLPAYPLPREVLGVEDLGALRSEPPKLDFTKPWAGKEEYIATMYTIMREDCAEPLRRCIATARECLATGDEVPAEEEIYIYEGGHLKGYLFSKIGAIARLQFATRRAKNKNKNEGSRARAQVLSAGNLVVLTTRSDGFRSNCQIAAIVQRPDFDAADKDDNVFEIGLLWTCEYDAVWNPAEELVMVEMGSNQQYFEASRHALEGLQRAAKMHSPLDKYILGKCTTPLPPAFLLTKGSSTMNLQSLLDKSQPAPSKTFDKLASYNVLSSAGFPDLENRSSLDDGQLQAVHHIISKEFTVLQGPPGTGKTRACLEALKILISNRRRNNNNNHEPPIIVAAQTNRALDQLLEQILDGGGQVVRIGGRTESSRLAKCSLFRSRYYNNNSNNNSSSSSSNNKNKSGNNSNNNKARETLEERLRQSVESIKKLVAMIYRDTPLDADILHGYEILNTSQRNSLNRQQPTSTPAGSSKTSSTKPHNGCIFSRWLGIELAEVDEAPATSSSTSRTAGKEDSTTKKKSNTTESPSVDEEESPGRISGTFVTLHKPWTPPSSTNKPSIGYELAGFMLSSQPRDLYKIEPKHRPAVYRLLRSLLERQIRTELVALHTENSRICKEIETLKWRQKAGLVLSKKPVSIDVVGCTITGLTKFWSLLVALSPRTLLVEEATAAREANITAAIFPTLEQLVLVGDPQQLSPRSAVDWLGKSPYCLDMSLVERWTKLGGLHLTLNVQRRMDPDIRALVGIFYPGMVDHSSVVLLPDAERKIPGMVYRCRFFDHKWQVDCLSDRSKSNTQEARMIAGFVDHLVTSGLDAAKITVLTFYRAQRDCLIRELVELGKKKKQKGTLDHVATNNTFTLDSYQGEENDVVILSMVRSPYPDSNKHEKGSLEDHRRVVVAVSRARRGLYIFGNVRNVVGDGSTEDTNSLWTKVWGTFFANQYASLEKNRGLPVVCQKHGTRSYITEPGDWEKRVGGCDAELCPLPPPPPPVDPKSRLLIDFGSSSADEEDEKGEEELATKLAGVAIEEKREAEEEKIGITRNAEEAGNATTVKKSDLAESSEGPKEKKKAEEPDNWLISFD